MRYSTIILLVLAWGQCFCQASFEKRLFIRVDQIKKLEFYDNGVVIKIDSVEYHDLSFPYWKLNEMYYQDDLARYDYRLYRVLSDSTIGHRPDTAQKDWTLSRGPHPYLFLRDTAAMMDLRTLMTDKHPYVRVYAFGALSFRKAENLFPFIVNNLGDTTEMLEFSSDVGMRVYPADLMIEYEAYRLRKGERQKLKKLIDSKYKHLSRGLKALSQK